MPSAPAKASAFDETRLTALLDLAGKDLSAELARRLVSDLSDVAQALTAQAKGLDRLVIRAQSHILIALAGTIGATGLTEAARQLNQMAHSGMDRSLRQSLRQTLTLLAVLLPSLAAWLGPLLGRP